MSMECEENKKEEQLIIHHLIETNKRKKSTEGNGNSTIPASKKAKNEKPQESGMLYAIDEKGNLKWGVPTGDSLQWLNYMILPREKLWKGDLQKF
jgi:hypothetical protein